MSKLRKIGALVTTPVFVAGLLLALVSAALMYTFLGVAFTKKQRRDLAVAGAIRTFVKAGEQAKEKGNVQEEVKGEIEVPNA